SLLNFVAPSKFTSYWRFRRRYCLEEKLPDKNISIVVGINPDRAMEFRDTVNSIGVRRLKREIFEDLPDTYETVIRVALNATQRRMYDEIKKELETLDHQGELLTSPNVLSQLSRLRQISVATPEVLSREYEAKSDRMVTRIRLIEPSSKLDALEELVDGT